MIAFSFRNFSFTKKKALLSMGFFLAIACATFGQDHRLTDSLEAVYASGGYPATAKLQILKDLAVNHGDSDKKLMYSQRLIMEAEVLDSVNYVYHGLLQKGHALRLKSDLSNALESYFQAARTIGEDNQSRMLGTVYTAIGDVYSIMGNHRNSVDYYQNGIRILRNHRDTLSIASALLNAGDEYINFEKLDSALIFTLEAESLFDAVGYPMGEAYSLGNMGMIYAKMGDDKRALDNMNEAIAILQEEQEFYPIAVYLTYISDIYLEKGDVKTALRYAANSLELAQRYGMKKEISDANLKLSEIHQQAGHLNEAFRYYKDHIAYKDSVNNISTVQQMADLRTNFEVSKKQIEVDLLNQQKRNQQIIVIATAIALFLLMLLAIGLFRRYRFIRETNQIIETEKNRSESLLLNILPKETAQELKVSGRVSAKRFESVTVLFTDFQGFTRYAEHASPERLVESVDFYFSRFDAIMEKYGLEKIKTLGDAYMCAGGLPFPTEGHAVRVVRAAMEIVDFVNGVKKEKADHTFDIRLGISSGPVVAGVVGTKKFAYDIWGDTVNIAARMESSSAPGKINVSENTYTLIKDYVDCEYRGEIDVKNKGMMKMYFVNSLRS